MGARGSRQDAIAKSLVFISSSELIYVEESEDVRIGPIILI